MQGGNRVATALTQISGYAHVAERYGFEEAVFLDSVVYWYRTNRANNRNFRDGRWWTYNSIKAFEEIFPWWSGKQIRRIANSCREQGALIAGEYNEDRRDRSLWYTPGDELLALYGLTETGKCTCPNGQMQSPKGADEAAQMGKCIYGIPCINHACTYMTPYSPPEGDGAVPDSGTGTSFGSAERPSRQPAAASDSAMTASSGHAELNCAQPLNVAVAQSSEDKPKAKSKKRKPRQSKYVPEHKPERFEQFWTYYPGGGSRLRAVAAWDNLAPSDELIDEMARALKRQKASRQWQDGVGIPHASTWLNQQRWTDKLPEPPQPQGSGFWAPDPEVTCRG